MTDTPEVLPIPEPTPALPPDPLPALASAEAASRLAAIEQLAGLTPATLPGLRALEKTAAQDTDPAVREAALQTLTAPAYRAVQQQDNRLSLPLRRAILIEIERWTGEGLLPAQTAPLLQQRYNFDLQQLAPTAVAPTPAGPRPTLSQVLLSETTIKVALYLGAFFVVVAAFILAAVFEVLRLPILGLATLGFLGAALALKRRLPTASFVLFTVFSFLLPIDAAVILDLVPLSESLSWLAWTGELLFLTLVWAGGTFLYRSRFFSVLALAAATLAMFCLARWVNSDLYLDVLLVQLPTVAALGAKVVLDRWQNRRFSLPLLVLAHLQQAVILITSLAILLVALVGMDLPEAGWWLVISLTWLLAALFYALSHRLTAFALFAPLAVAALAPIPLFLSGLFSPGWQAVMMVAWVWATLLAAGGEVLARLKWPFLAGYSLWVTLASAGLYLLAAGAGLIDDVAFGLAYLTGTALVYFGLTLYRPRVWLWSASLLAAAAAYLAVFFLPDVEAYDFYPGFILLWPALALLSLGLVLWRTLPPRWYLPPLILGSLIGGLTCLVLLASGFDEPGRAVIAWGIIAGFLALFGLLARRPWLGYGAATSLALAVGFGLVWAELDYWVLPLMGLAALYYAAGLILSLLGRSAAWAAVLRFSGLGLAALVGLSAPTQGGAGGAIGAALGATFFAIEAFRLRQVWLGLPANLLYLAAYITLLAELEVDQPQFYSIGAALLGFIMHYFLVKSGSKWAAFITGLLSQFILLGTSYVQMFSTQELVYFFVLFGQAMVVLVYGLVVRSRSLLIAPLVFVVLGVITVALSVLAGVPALLLIGCTGLLLLIVGIAALVMREKLLAMTNRLGERLGGWQA